MINNARVGHPWLKYSRFLQKGI